MDRGNEAQDKEFRKGDAFARADYRFIPSNTLADYRFLPFNTLAQNTPTNASTQPSSCSQKHSFRSSDPDFRKVHGKVVSRIPHPP
jgi:hypothetical protein